MAPSAYFSVQLPVSLADEEFVRIFEWAQQNCLQSNIIREGDGGYLLIAQREDQRDVRNRQRLILTNYKHWGIDTSRQPKGWLKVLTEAEFNAMNEQKGDARDNERDVLQNEDDTEIAELTSMTEPSNGTKNTADLQAFAHHAAAKLRLLTLPPNLLTDPAFFIIPAH